MNNEKITFGLVHGSFHGAWCWELLQAKIHKLGHRTLTVDLPIHDPRADFDDYANVAAEAFENTDNLVLVGHSRGGNVIPRTAGLIAVKKMIFLSASFHEATLPQAEHVQIPVRMNEDYMKQVQNIGNGLTTFDKKHALEYFYHDCTEEVASWAAGRLRPQRRCNTEPLLEAWPKIPQEYIIATQDRVVNPKWSRYIAHDYLGIEPSEISSGHSPMLSQSSLLARQLVSLALKGTN